MFDLFLAESVEFHWVFSTDPTLSTGVLPLRRLHSVMPPPRCRTVTATVFSVLNASSLFVCLFIHNGNCSICTVHPHIRTYKCIKRLFLLNGSKSYQRWLKWLFLLHIFLLLLPPPPSVLCPTGGVEHHWDGAGHEQVHRLRPAASADPLRRSLCQHGALCTADRFHAADHLQAVQRSLAH